MHFLRQLLTYSFGRRNCLDAGSAQALHGTKLSQEKIFPVLADAGAIIQHHVVANGTYRELVGRSVSAEEIEARTRAHVTQVILRSLGLDEPRDAAKH